MKEEYEVLNICKALDQKKGDDILVIDTSKITSICDYIILATATSSTHVKALAQHVFENVTMQSLTKEGYGESSWIIIDYGFVIVHMFTKELRAYYNLEKLYSEGKSKKFASFQKDLTQKEKKAEKDKLSKEKQAEKTQKAIDKKAEKISKKTTEKPQSTKALNDKTTSDDEALNNKL